MFAFFQGGISEQLPTEQDTLTAKACKNQFFVHLRASYRRLDNALTASMTL